MNSFIASFLNLGKRMPRVRQVRAPIFILGTGRSGTTILGKVLSMHRDVGWLNEPKLLWHMVYPYEDLIGSFSQGVAYYQLDASQATDDVRQTIHQLYGFYLSVTRSRRVVDKYPEMIFRTEFLQALFPDAKFIFLVRDGSDTVGSIEWWSQSFGHVRGETTHDWWGVNRRKWKLLKEQVVADSPDLARALADVDDFTQHKDMAAVEWIATMQQGLRLIDEMPQQIHLVRYEELVGRPRDILSQVANFCELSSDEVFLSYACQVLKPPSKRDPALLDPSIQAVFAKTMTLLGYER